MTPNIPPELDHPTFRLAVAQFDQAANHMVLDPNLLERLKAPQRALSVSIPVRMDDGRVEVFRVRRFFSNAVPPAGLPPVLAITIGKSGYSLSLSGYHDALLGPACSRFFSDIWQVTVQMNFARASK